MPLRSPRSWGEASDLIGSALSDPSLASGGLGALLQQIIGQRAGGANKDPFDLGTSGIDSGGIDLRSMQRQQKHAQRQEMQDQRHDIQRERRQAKHGGGDGGGGGRGALGGGGRAGGIAANWRAAHGGGPGGSPGGGNPMLNHPAVSFGRQMAGAGPGGGMTDAIRQKVAGALAGRGMSQDASGTWRIAGLAQPSDPGRMLRDAALRSMGGPGWAERVAGADAAGFDRFPQPQADHIANAIRGGITPGVNGAVPSPGLGAGSLETGALGAQPGGIEGLAATIRSRLNAPQGGDLAQQIMSDVLGHVGQQRGLGTTPSTDALVSAIRQQTANQARQGATGTPSPGWPGERMTQTGPLLGPGGTLAWPETAPGQQTVDPRMIAGSPVQVSKENRNLAALGQLPLSGQAVGSTTTQAPLTGTTPGFADTSGREGVVNPNTTAAPATTGSYGPGWPGDQMDALNSAYDSQATQTGIPGNVVKAIQTLETGGNVTGYTGQQNCNVPGHADCVALNSGIFQSTAESYGLDYNRIVNDSGYAAYAVGVVLQNVANSDAGSWGGPAGQTVYDAGGWNAVANVYFSGQFAGGGDTVGTSSDSYVTNFNNYLQQLGGAGGMVGTTPPASGQPQTVPGQTNTGWGAQPIPGNPGGFHGTTPAPAPGSQNTVWGAQPIPGAQPAPNGAVLSPGLGGVAPLPGTPGAMDPAALPPPRPGAAPVPIPGGNVLLPTQPAPGTGPNAQINPNGGIPTTPPALPPGVVLNDQGVPVDDPNVPRGSAPAGQPGQPPTGTVGSNSTTTPATVAPAGAISTTMSIVDQPAYGVKHGDGSDQSWMIQQAGGADAPVSSDYDDPFTIGPWYDYQTAYGAPGDVHAAYDIAYPKGTPISGVQNLTGTVECVSCGSYCTGGIAADGSLYCDGVGVGQINLNLDPSTQGGNTITMIYGHMLTSDVSPGQRVDVGTPIGTTGYAGSGAHLHQEARAYCPSGCTCPGGGTETGWRIIDPTLVADGYYQTHDACTDGPL